MTSSDVVYTEAEARAVAAIPNRRCRGCAQWCPTRTAMPAASSTWPDVVRVDALERRTRSTARRSSGVGRADASARPGRSRVLEQRTTAMVVLVGLDRCPCPMLVEVLDRGAETDDLRDRRGARLELVRGGAYVDRSSATVSIISPPPRNGGSASEQLAPAPQHPDAGRAAHLVPGRTPAKSARRRSCTSTRQVRHRLGGVEDTMGADLLRPPAHDRPRPG